MLPTSTISSMSRLTALHCTTSAYVMRYVGIYSSVVLGIAALSGCVVASDTATETPGSVAAAIVTGSNAVRELVALAAPNSPGGANITATEATRYIAKIDRFGGDEAVDALGVLGRFSSSGESVNLLTNALRRRVDGLRIAGFGVDGLTISSCGRNAVGATFNPNGASYTGATIVYSSDAWQTSHAATLTKGADGQFRADLPGIDVRARITFAVQLSTAQGNFWLNNPRENAQAAPGHVDFRQSVDLCQPSVTPATPPLARLVASFALRDSLGGTTITGNEFSWLVAQTTWEGGPGMDGPSAIDPAITELDRLASSGVQFEADSYNGMRVFLTQMRMRNQRSERIPVMRDQDTSTTTITAPLGTQFMRVYFSTDGWANARVTECTPSGRVGYVTCALGTMPRGTLLSYSAVVRNAGGESTVRAADGGNFFTHIP
jgi:hypothetical protein